MIVTDEEIEAAAHECMKFVVSEVSRQGGGIASFDGTHPFVQCIQRGIDRVAEANGNDPLVIGFEVPDASNDIQMMSVWSDALKMFDVSADHKMAALKWFESYAKSEIKKQRIEEANDDHS